MRRRTLCAASALAMMTPIPVSAFSFAEDEFDVVVAGAGGAGLAAALSAAEQGASVLLVEKMAAIGGNTLRASGLFNASDPARQEPMGITDSPSWHYEQTMASGHGRNDPAVVRRFVCEALPTLKWLESLGVRFMPETVATWGAEWPRGHKPTQPRGQAYIRTLSSECIRRGVKIRTRCAMTRLLMKNGRAASIEVEDLSSGRGKDKMIFHARKAVILTAGGFAANPELVESYRADLAGIPTDNNPGSTGEVMLEAIRAGAASNALECIQCVPGAPEGRGFQVRLDLDAGRVLMVDGGGRRFIDEDGSRDGLAKAILARPRGSVWMVTDDGAVKAMDLRKLFKSTLNNRLHRNLACVIDKSSRSAKLKRAFEELPLISRKDVYRGLQTGDALRADSWDALALLMGVDADALKDSVRVFNVEAGMGGGKCARVRCLQLSEPPYWASRVVLNIHTTMGGLVITPDAQVVGLDGKPVTGLFAAGEITGSVHGENRMGGNGIADALTFGRIAGRTAVLKR